ncbi:hypothetical protein CEP52_007097 [Fusarium oligoseptatum]|uniref:MARVEL domain-containing protein n=1 Tax=Fusarium oligoseptatum TaxID=2604345 RepID=A0A428TPJ4_9HYPO|nr:hypothetical protein CEP52_007097 [Fusarium oligoseptatum]
MSATTTSTHGLTVTGVPKMPLWLTILRVAALVLSLGVLIAAAYHLSLLGGWSQYYSIFTFLILGGMLAAEFFAPHMYLRLLFVGALILDAIFLAFRLGMGRFLDFEAWGASMLAGSVLGVFTWVVIIVITVFFVKACMDSPQDSSFSPRAPADPEMGQPKPEGMSQPQYA